jgi:hypothetical protein
MRKLLSDTDRLLRGLLTRREDLIEGRVTADPRVLIAIGVVLGAVYGVSMGVYGWMRPEHATWKQALANAVKVPSLFLLTLVVAFPSLYAFSALANSKLRFGDTLRLLLAAVAVSLALLASLSPVTAFFTVSTTSYSFMVLLNVVFFALCGAVGLVFLRRALDAIFIGKLAPPPLLAAGEGGESTRPEREAQNRQRWSEWKREVARPRRIFACWFLIYALVGAQMGWVLRPFIGTPELEFTLLRPRQGNFFVALFTALWQFLSGH